MGRWCVISEATARKFVKPTEATPVPAAVARAPLLFAGAADAASVGGRRKRRRRDSDDESSSASEEEEEEEDVGED